MRKSHGVIGIMVLWMLTAISAISFSALAIGRWQRSRGSQQMALTRALLLAKGAVALARESGLDFLDQTYMFDTGRVRVERLPFSAPDARLYKLVARAGMCEKEIEVGWQRIGGQWTAVSWNEIR